MQIALDFLLTHMSRWRSFVIFTDTWAPMHAALKRIQPMISSTGAPRLEVLTLMRCNEYASYRSAFLPHDLRYPALFSSSTDAGTTCPSARLDPFPRLRKLSLRGVHVDWSGLSPIMTNKGEPGLTTLELTSHAWDVRPSLFDFRRILSAASARLSKLVVSGSGPGVTEEDEANYQATAGLELDRVLLPNLKELKLGYRSVYEGQLVLSVIHVPNLRELGLEDTSHPCETEDEDAGELLSYVLGISAPRVSTAVAIAESRRRNHLPHQGPNPSEFLGWPIATSTLPSLEKATLTRVNSSSRTLRAFFGALPNLRQLELDGMSTHGVRALLPSASDQVQNQDINPAEGHEKCPCPLLRSLQIRVFDSFEEEDMTLLMSSLALERQKGGGLRCAQLQEVDIQLCSLEAGVMNGEWFGAPEEPCVSERGGTSVKIQKSAPVEAGSGDGNYW